MGKKRAAEGPKFSVGTSIRVRPEITSADIPDFPIGGWAGTVVEVASKKPPRKYIIEWDPATVDAMPPEYLNGCEEQQLYFKMICLREDEVEAAE